MGYLVNANGYDDIVLSDDWTVKLMGSRTNDIRYGCVQSDGGKGSKSGLRYIWKYPVQTGETTLYYGNIKVLRLSETYLIAAEAAAKSGHNDDAVKYLNAIAMRGDATNDFTGKTVTLDDVLTERRIELVGEGHRFFDAIRNHKRITRSTDNTFKHLPGIQPEAWDFDWDYYKVVLAVPVHEVNANSEIGQQNPGY
jgi:hypothetical protein